MKQLEKGMLSHKSLRSYDPLSVVITKHMQSLLISNDYLLLDTFLAVASLPESKGLSCLTFLKFQPLEKPVACKIEKVRCF